MQLCNRTKNIEVINNNYKERYELFYNKFCLLDDGKATKRVVEKVIN
ncbi:CDP-glycerol glycerophosphotransferase family protein [Staphylococcus aureus]|nr:MULTISPECIES: CDP-glycerol glycerophosphotransferase family protein [Staphylococcus]